jgi:probable F420-dependent oxidoreductase
VKIGLHPTGIGPGAYPEFIAAMARTAEQVGFHSIWAGEHVVLFDEHVSRYPYSMDGKLPAPAQIDILDPFVTLTYAAAHTTTLRIGSGIVVLPQRSPLITAKLVASLDRVSGGRFDFGVGIGWLEEEFSALGVPFERRAERFREYVQVLRTLWTEQEPEFHGEFVDFPKLRMYPKPAQQPHPPIIIGGNSQAALRRAAETGDGWFGVGLSLDDLRSGISAIERYAREAGRRPGDIRIVAHAQPAAAPNVTGRGPVIELDTVKRFRDAGADEFILNATLTTIEEMSAALELLGEQIVVPASRL